MRTAIALLLIVAVVLADPSLKPFKRNVYIRQGRGFTFPAMEKMEPNREYTYSENAYGWLKVKSLDTGYEGYVHCSEVTDKDGKPILPASRSYTRVIIQPPVNTPVTISESSTEPIDYATSEQLSNMMNYLANYKRLIDANVKG